MNCLTAWRRDIRAVVVSVSFFDFLFYERVFSFSKQNFVTWVTRGSHQDSGHILFLMDNDNCDIGLNNCRKIICIPDNLFFLF